MLQSLFFALDQEIFPYKVNNTQITSALTSLFFEISSHYGKNMVADIEIAILADNGDFLTLNKSAGIEVGRHGNAMLQLMLFAANDTTKRELAV
jgi:hypothetical protein